MWREVHWVTLGVCLIYPLFTEAILHQGKPPLGWNSYGRCVMSAFGMMKIVLIPVHLSVHEWISNGKHWHMIEGNDMKKPGTLLRYTRPTLPTHMSTQKSLFKATYFFSLIIDVPNGVNSLFFHILRRGRGTSLLSSCSSKPVSVRLTNFKLE